MARRLLRIRPDRCFSWDMRLPELMVVHIGPCQDTTSDTARQMSHDKWGCLISWLFTSDLPKDYFGHGPIDVCRDRWSSVVSRLSTSDMARRLLWTRPDRCLSWKTELPELMVVHVGRGPEITLDTAWQMSAMDKEKSHVWLLRFNISIKVPFPNRKNNDSRDKTSQSKRL